MLHKQYRHRFGLLLQAEILSSCLSSSEWCPPSSRVPFVLWAPSGLLLCSSIRPSVHPPLWSLIHSSICLHLGNPKCLPLEPALVNLKSRDEGHDQWLHGRTEDRWRILINQLINLTTKQIFTEYLPRALNRQMEVLPEHPGTNKIAAPRRTSETQRKQMLACQKPTVSQRRVKQAWAQQVPGGQGARRGAVRQGFPERWHFDQRRRSR